MHHRWESLLFAHWSVSPARIQATLPVGLNVDTFEGKAYLGVAPFFMRNVRPVGFPALPWLSHFQELNVRTYVYDNHGVPGIWFYSLDCSQPLAVLGARVAIGLPYFNAAMEATIGDYIDYRSQRNGSAAPARYRFRGVGEARDSEPESWEFFVLERYYLFAERAGTLVRGQVLHERYRYREANLVECSTLPAQLDGFTEITGAPMHACFVDGFDVKVYGTQKIERAA
jgi:uncharacterized protein